MYDGDILHPIQDYFDKWELKSDFYPNVLDMARVKPGQPILFVPNHLIVNYLYVRLDWLKEANLQPPDTFEDMIKAAKAMTKAPDRFGFGLRAGDIQGLSMLGHWYMGNGVKFIDEKDESDFDSKAAIETTEQYAAMYTKDKSAQPSAPADRFPQLFAQFQGGKLAMLQHGLHSWKVQDAALGDKITAVVDPQGQGSACRLRQCRGHADLQGHQEPGGSLGVRQVHGRGGAGEGVRDPARRRPDPEERGRRPDLQGQPLLQGGDGLAA